MFDNEECMTRVQKKDRCGQVMSLTSSQPRSVLTPTSSMFTTSSIPSNIGNVLSYWLLCMYLNNCFRTRIYLKGETDDAAQSQDPYMSLIMSTRTPYSNCGLQSKCSSSLLNCNLFSPHSSGSEKWHCAASVNCVSILIPIIRD